jgi:hypothetical protein
LKFCSISEAGRFIRARFTQARVLVDFITEVSLNGAFNTRVIHDVSGLVYPAILGGICTGKSERLATMGRKLRWICRASVARTDASRKWSSTGTGRSSKIRARTFFDP